MTQVRGNKQKNSNPSDGELLTLIGRKNHDAFAQLYQRYHQKAMSVAHYLCKDHEQSEEAVQNAMIDVWKSARRCRADNPKAWILRIVARHCIKLSKKSNKINAREQHGEEAQWTDRTSEQALGNSDDKEVSAVLQSALKKLPEKDRRIVALYYAGGASQDEIAQELALSQKGISKRIARILEHLRISLIQAGCAALPAAVFSKEIEAAICHGNHAFSSDQFAIVIERIEDELEKKIVVKSSITGHYIWLAVPIAIFLAASAVGIYQFAKAGIPATGSANDSETTWLDGQWTFENGPSKDLELLGGKWHWWPAYERRKAVMAVPPTGMVILKLPPILPDHPVEVIVTTQGPIHQTRIPRMIFLVCHESKSLPYRAWKKDSMVKLGSRFVYRAVINGTRIIKEANGEPWAVLEYREPISKKQIGLAMTNLMIEKIEIRKLPELNLPRKYHEEPTKMLNKSLKAQPGASVSFKQLNQPADNLRSKQWAFDKWPQKEFERISGKTWRREPAKGKLPSAFVVPTGDGPVALKLPMALSIHPFIVTLDVEAESDRQSIVQFAWGTDMGTHTFAKGTTQHRSKLKQKSKLTFYFNRRYVIQEINGKRSVVSRYNYPFGGKDLTLIIYNVRLNSIKFREVSLDEFPATYRDPKALLGQPMGTVLKAGD